jgi:hypothetical protein
MWVVEEVGVSVLGGKKEAQKRTNGDTVSYDLRVFWFYTEGHAVSKNGLVR